MGVVYIWAVTTELESGGYKIVDFLVGLRVIY